MVDLKIDLVGDINLRKDGNFDESCLDDVRAELAQADVRMANLEGCLADASAHLATKPTWLHPQPEMVACVVGNFDAVSCANNVTFGDEAIIQSLRSLDAHHVAHSGAGIVVKDAYDPAIVKAKGARIGMLSFSCAIEALHNAREDGPGIAVIHKFFAEETEPRVDAPGGRTVLHSWIDEGELDRACANVRSLRPSVDFLVVYMHFGSRDNPVVEEYQRVVAHTLVEAGADVIAGSHSHVVSGIERYGSSLIFYGMGNFAFTPGFRDDMPCDGMLAKLDVRDNKLVGCTLLPTSRGANGRTEVLGLGDDKGRSIADSIIDEAGTLGTSVTEADGELVLAL